MRNETKTRTRLGWVGGLGYWAVGTGSGPVGTGTGGQDQDGLIECCEKELVGRAAKLVAGGGVSLGWTGRSAVWLV